jgi:hypothetical protein
MAVEVAGGEAREVEAREVILLLWLKTGDGQLWRCSLASNPIGVEQEGEATEVGVEEGAVVGTKIKDTGQGHIRRPHLPTLRYRRASIPSRPPQTRSQPGSRWAAINRKTTMVQIRTRLPSRRPAPRTRCRLLPSQLL